MIELKNASIGYKNKPIMTKLSINFKKNEFVCLLGANGCGKTTLIKSILGLLPYYEGEINLLKKPLQTYNKKTLASILAYVPQSVHINSFSVEDVVLMALVSCVAWYESPKDRKGVLEVLERLKIAHLIDRRFDELSGGERQLVLIARALMQKASILILDEPTSHLDFGNEVRILECLESLKNEGFSIILSTHNPKHALFFSCRAVLFSEGKILADAHPKEVINLKNLSQIYKLEQKNLKKHFKELE